ncbi:hypothetical protein KFE25_006748 [Diacronema lutheri]|uniref:Major facilitator superfamily (MFS) profile domain-containing protein n=1 Tax=Diacronema lutheri TaxID=2081491 RepID=A0A8J5XF59_DIALT|nr:hypothetical protein KFE25_006748 [Diacronema lutheri]
MAPPRLPPSPLLVKLAASVGFLADAYDLFVINIATTILRSVYPAAPPWSEPLVKSAILLGTIAGQVGLGAAGDRLGRRAAFLVSMGVCIVCSTLSGVAVRRIGTDASVFGALAACRLLLGVGIGGEYPLSAAIVAEATAEAAAGGQSRALATVFSMQGLGNCAAPLLAWALLAAGVPLDLAWRLVLCAGALPFVATMPLRLRLSDSLEYAAAKKRLRPAAEWASEIWRAHRAALAGTAGSWFLFDIVFYGNGLFQADFVQLLRPADEVGTRDGLVATARVSLLISLLGLPGYWAAVALARDDMRSQRNVQALGFGACALIYAVMARWFAQVRASPPLFVLLYGSSFFFSNCGPNTTTFILPACYFPAKHRAVCHGLSAAAGKLGALVAALVFRPCVVRFGPAAVFAACAVVSASGLCFTWALVPTAPCAPDSLDASGLAEALTSPTADDGHAADEADDRAGAYEPGEPAEALLHDAVAGAAIADVRRATPADGDHSGSETVAQVNDI